MIRKILDFCIRERLLILLGSAAVIAYGWYSTQNVPLDAIPNVGENQVIVLTEFLDKKTPFSTKHGVKGAEFENVLVVAGRGWNLYNFNHFLEWAGAENVPANKQDAFERNRNLYYVSFSRPKSRLAVLVTQELSERALNTLTAWFGEDTVQSLGHIDVTT